MKRAIVIGCREKHDREAILIIEAWCERTGRQRFFNQDMVIDPYDMTTKPKKGDAVKALRQHKDTHVVIACHIFSMSVEQGKQYADLEHKACQDGWMYTKENHKLLDICLRRNIPLFVLGDQPIHEYAKLPKTVQRTHVGEVRRYDSNSFLTHKIFLYERA